MGKAKDNLFRNEFLDYLNKNHMGSYALYDEKESQYSTFEKELIGNVTHMAEELIQKMSEGRGISPEIHLFCVKNELVNAFCFVTSKRYYIGIHSATYIELIRRTQILADYLIQNEELEYYRGKEATDVQALLWTYAFKMILSHEYMHIILGHCDVICSEKAFLWENNVAEDFSLYQQLNLTDLKAVELLADEFAAMDIAWQVLSRTETIDEIKYELLNYYLAVMLVFSIFHNYGAAEETHPKLGIRLHSIISTVDDTIVKGLEVPYPQMEIEKIDTVIDVFMEIIQQFPRLLFYDIITELGVEDFDRQYLKLYNAAADLVKWTNRKAIYPINEFEKMNESILEVLDMERDVLWNAQKNGLSYEDACDLIEKIKQQDESGEKYTK